MQIEVTKAIILRMRHGRDKITFDTTLPCGSHPYTGTQDFTTEVSRGTAEKYMLDHFRDLPYELIQVDAH